MGLRITVASLDREKGVCRMAVTTGDVRTCSYPQSSSDNFRDLHANRRMISERRLASLFFGEEPVLNIEYGNDGLVHAHVFREGASGPEKMEGDFSVQDALSSIDDALAELDATFGIQEQEKKYLLDQVAEDMTHGIYDVYQVS